MGYEHQGRDTVLQTGLNIHWSRGARGCAARSSTLSSECGSCLPRDFQESADDSVITAAGMLCMPGSPGLLIRAGPSWIPGACPSVPHSLNTSCETCVVLLPRLAPWRARVGTGAKQHHSSATAASLVFARHCDDCNVSRAARLPCEALLGGGLCSIITHTGPSRFLERCVLCQQGCQLSTTKRPECK